jgi:hypothetical protein
VKETLTTLAADMFYATGLYERDVFVTVREWYTTLTFVSFLVGVKINYPEMTLILLPSTVATKSEEFIKVFCWSTIETLIG